MNSEELIRDGWGLAAPYRFAEPNRTPRARTGFQRGALAGSSLDYKDFREYRPGDDLRHLDWGAYARTDKMIVKRYHEEVIPHLDLILDTTSSMDLPHGRKRDALVFLAAFFAGVAANSGYSRRTWLMGERCEPMPHDREEPFTWPDLTCDSGCSPAPALLERCPSLRRMGMRVVISDLLWPEQPESILAALAAESAAVLLVRLMGQSDLEPPKRGKLRLVDSETGTTREVLVDPATYERYQQRLSQHRSAWETAARKSGVGLAWINAEAMMAQPDFSDPALQRFLKI